jgi:hypothetical protein
MKYRILICGDGCYIPTGYGVQILMLVKRLLEKGHEVIMFDTSFPMDNFKGEIYNVKQFLDEYFEKIKDKKLPYINVGEQIKNACICFKTSDTPFPYKDIAHYIKKTQPDCYIILKDLNNYDKSMRFQLPSICYVPVDTYPISPDILDKLILFDKIISISDYGRKQIKNNGYNVDFISHSIDTPLIRETLKKDKTELKKNGDYQLINLL